MIARIIHLVIAGVVHDEELRAAIAGDLLEDSGLHRAARGRISASLWLARQLLLSLPHLASLSSRGNTACFSARCVARLYFTYAVVGALGVTSTVVSTTPLGIAGAAGSTVMATRVAMTAVVALIAGWLGAFTARRVPLVAGIGIALVAVGAAMGQRLLDSNESSPVRWLALQLAICCAIIAGSLVRVSATIAARSPTPS